MIRSELVARIAEQNPRLYARDVERVVSAIFDRMAGALANGDRVEIRDFGTFSVRNSPARISRNPHTSDRVTVPARAHVQFKPGKGMRARLNLGRIELGEETERLLRAS